MSRPPTVEEIAIIESATRALAKLPKRKPITVAYVMKVLGEDTRTSVRFLRILEEAGLLIRSGGGPGQPLLWNRIVKPEPIPAPTMIERAAAAEAARKLTACLWDATAMGAEGVMHIDYSRPKRSEWIWTWENLPGFRCVNGTFQHELLPGWQYKQQEVIKEMIPDLVILAERGERPTEATS